MTDFIQFLKKFPVWKVSHHIRFQNFLPAWGNISSSSSRKGFVKRVLE
jgi:hypothetical protein